MTAFGALACGKGWTRSPLLRGVAGLTPLPKTLAPGPVTRAEFFMTLPFHHFAITAGNERPDTLFPAGRSMRRADDKPGAEPLIQPRRFDRRVRRRTRLSRRRNDVLIGAFLLKRDQQLSGA